MQQAIITHVYISNNAQYSRVWCRTADATHNFDVVEARDARKYQPGMEVWIKVENYRR